MVCPSLEGASVASKLSSTRLTFVELASPILAPNESTSRQLLEEMSNTHENYSIRCLKGKFTSTDYHSIQRFFELKAVSWPNNLFKRANDVAAGVAG